MTFWKGNHLIDTATVFLFSLGATIPSKTKTTESKQKETHYEHQDESEEKCKDTEPDIPPPELDEDGVVEDKSDEVHLPMGDESKEVVCKP